MQTNSSLKQIMSIVRRDRILTYYFDGKVIPKKTGQQWLPNRKIIPSKRHKTWHTTHYYPLISLRNKLRLKTIDYPVEIVCEFGKKGKRRTDRINMLESIYDILVDVKILKDDNDIIISRESSYTILTNKDYCNLSINKLS